jgi:hypothetical protein
MLVFPFVSAGFAALLLAAVALEVRREERRAQLVRRECRS